MTDPKNPAGLGNSPPKHSSHEHKEWRSIANSEILLGSITKRESQDATSVSQRLSTYNPDLIFEKSPVLVPNVMLVELEPVSELLN